MVWVLTVGRLVRRNDGTVGSRAASTRAEWSATHTRRDVVLMKSRSDPSSLPAITGRGLEMGAGA